MHTHHLSCITDHSLTDHWLTHHRLTHHLGVWACVFVAYVYGELSRWRAGTPANLGKLYVREQGAGSREQGAGSREQ